MKYKLRFPGYWKIFIYIKNIYQDTYFVKQYLQSQKFTLHFEKFLISIVIILTCTIVKRLKQKKSISDLTWLKMDPYES